MAIVGKERTRDLEFEVIREPWNRYSIREGPTLQFRFILLRLTKIEEVNPDGTVVATKQAKYNIEGQTLTAVFNIPPRLKGTPDTTAYGPQDLQTAVIADDVPVDTIMEEWNDYVADDGTKIRVKCSVISVSRTSKYNKNGEPIYVVSSSQQVAVKIKKP